MRTIEGTRFNRPTGAEPTVLPCNFRSAGRLSNESARALTSLHEVLARNLTNSLDVYLGTGLDVRLAALEQLTMEEFRAKCLLGGYMLPCATRPAAGTVLLEMDNPLMFTMIDLLLGGSGAKLETVRELTEIDEEIMEGVGSLVAQQIERVWQAVGYALTPGKCVKPNVAHRVFPASEKILRIRFDASVAGMTGALFVSFQAALAGHLVRSIRADHSHGRNGSSYAQLPSLRTRILECRFGVSGDLPNLRVSVRDLAQIRPGSVLMLSAPVDASGKLTLEGRTYFEALPVRQGNQKAMQLLSAVAAPEAESRTLEG